jgi:type I restriction enzyme, S subunit
MTWPIKKLGEVLDKIVGGGTPSKSNSEYWGGNIPWASVKDIKEGVAILDRTQDYITETGLKNSAANLIPTGTIIISTRMGLGRVVKSMINVAINQDLKALFPKKELDSDYLFFFLKSRAKELIEKGAGATVSGIRLDQLRGIEIPLPQLEIQKKIVKKIEELFAKIDKTQILREASVQDANNLISTSLEQIIHKASGWKEYTIGELTDNLQAGFACGKQNEVNEGVIHLRTHNINLNGELNLDKVVIIPNSLVSKSAYGLKQGDILFNNTNSTELVGKTIIIRKDLPYAFSNHLNRIRVNTSIVLPEWILYIFQKFWRDKYFESICTRWIGQSGINQGKLVTIKVPVPSLAEQKKIVKQLDRLTQKVRELHSLQIKTVADLEMLKKSIIHKAFQGELI